MQKVLLVVHICLALGLVGLVLLQRGKGAEAGAAFGAGASSTVFGSQGSASFLTRATAVIATLFFVTSLSLAYMSGQRVESKSVTELATPVEPEPAAPVTDIPVSELPVEPAAPADVPVIPEQDDSVGTDPQPEQ